jgi:Protein of unknown function (DUF664)
MSAILRGWTPPFPSPPTHMPRGRPGPRWSGAEPATLERVLFHLLREYARHLGQLDVVVELITGATSD